MGDLAIDFGAAATKVAYRGGSGEIEPVRFDGLPEFPTAVFVDPAGKLVVDDADSYLGTGRVVTGFKHRVAAVEDRPPQDRTVSVGDANVPLMDLVTAVLVHAIAAVHGHVGRLVLSHPVTWGSAERQFLRAAALRAGLSQRQSVVFVTEPEAAAANAYARGLLPQDAATAVVFDLGASTLDVAVVDVSDIRHGGSARADWGVPTGGDDLDAAFLDLVEDELSCIDGGEPLSGFQLYRDTKAARATKSAREDKEQLSAEHKVIHPALILLAGGLSSKHIDITVSRVIWEQRITDQVTEWVDLLETALDHVAPGGRGTVLLATGGSTLVPLVRAELYRIANNTSLPLVLVDEADELGAGRQVAPGALLVAAARDERERVAREAAVAAERAERSRLVRESFDQALGRAAGRWAISDKAIEAVRALLPENERVLDALSWRDSSDFIDVSRFLASKLGLMVLTEDSVVWSCLSGVVRGIASRDEVEKVEFTARADSLVQYGHVKFILKDRVNRKFWRLTDGELDSIRRWIRR